MKLEGFGKVTRDVLDKPARIVFKDTDSVQFISKNLGETVTKTLHDLHTKKPFKEDKSAIHSLSESQLLDNKNIAKAEVQKIKGSPEYVSLKTKIDEKKTMISGIRTHINQLVAETIEFNKKHEKDPTIKPKKIDPEVMKSLADSMSRLMGEVEKLDDERVRMVKPAEDASKAADSDYRKLIQSGVTKYSRL